MTDLITRAEYKTYRGISGANDDGKIDVIISSVSDLVKTYCGRTFLDYHSVDKTENFSFTWEAPSVFLSEIPIVSITSVQELQSGSNSTYDTLTTDQYVVDVTMDAIYRVENGIKQNFPKGVNAVKVVYKGGFASVPNDLKLALYDIVTYYLKEQFIPEKNHSSFTIRQSPEGADFPAHIKRVLDLYRDV